MSTARPANRTPEQLRHHFEVERRLADRLRTSTREERLSLYPTLYDELFREVPDHPRLTRRETPAQRRRAVAARMRLLRPYLTATTVFAEFAPGDCRLAFEAARHVAKVYGIDISDQSGADDRPDNCAILVYDGYCVPLPDQSVDLAFSYQLIEHLHPDDTPHHFAEAARILRPGGRYVLSTPHAYSGPHDISRHFSHTPRGFHLREWTYAGLGGVLRSAGFERWYTFRLGRPRPGGWVKALTLAAERSIGLLPAAWRRRASARVFDAVNVVAERG